MKKLILLITTLAFLMVMCGTFQSMAQRPPRPNQYDKTINTLITFYPRPKPGKPRPRSATFVPVTCTYDYSSQSFRFRFLEDIGEMTITVINHSTGEQSFEYIDSTFESAEVYISGEEGQYSISIDVADGSSYYSEFEL